MTLKLSYLSSRWRVYVCPVVEVQDLHLVGGVQQPCLIGGAVGSYLSARNVFVEGTLIYLKGGFEIAGIEVKVEIVEIVFCISD